MGIITSLLARLGLHIDQNTWGTYAGKLLGVVALVAGGLLCPADILMAGFGISISAAAETRIVWWCVAVGIVSGYLSAHATDRRMPTPTQSPTGGRMTVGLWLTVAALGGLLSLPACAALSGLRPGPNGYTRAQVATLLSDASWGLQEGCSRGWVSEPVCGDTLVGLKTANDVAASAPADTMQADVIAALRRIKARLGAGSRATPYFDYVIKLLGGQ